jgi:type I restriction enzyme S subunit
VETRFLYWYLASVRNELIGRGKGGTQQNISQTVLKAVPFPLAPLGEQRRIVAALEEFIPDLDAAVMGLKRARTNLKRWQAAHLLAATRSVSGDSAIGDGPDPWPLPAGWRWTTVDAVGDVLLGRQRAPQYLTGRYPRPYLRVANVGDDMLRLADVKQMDFDERHAAKYMLRPGDILVSEGQSPELVGQSAIYRGEIPGACFQKTLHRFRAYQEHVLPEFAQLVFRSFVKGGVFQRYASLTVNIAHLTLERFKAVPFPLPPLDEQRSIVAEVHERSAVATRTAADIDVQLARADRLRQAILQHAFSGRLVPQDRADEPASTLLTRLRAALKPRPAAGARGRGRPQATPSR